MATDTIEILIEAKVKEALKNLGLVEGKTGGLGKKSKSLFSTLKTGWIAVAGVVIGVSKALFDAGKMAIRFEEANAKFLTTFKAVQKEANAMRQELVKAYGVSSIAATELLSNTGDLLSGFGFTGEAALELSGKVNKLAIDLASFTNAQGGAEAVSQALTKALIGERESLKTYGVAILEVDIKNRLLKKGQENLTGIALRQAKAVATLEIAYEQSKNAVGDFERTSDSTANTLRRIKAIATDVQTVLGQEMLNALQPTIRSLDEFIKVDKGIAIVRKTFKALALTIQILWQSTLKPVMVGFFLLFSPIIESIKETVRLVGVWGDDSLTLGQKIKEMGTGVKNVFTGVKNAAGNAATGIVDDYVDMGKKLFDLFTTVEETTVDGMENTTNEFKNQLQIREDADISATKKRIKLMQDVLAMVVNVEQGIFKTVSLFAGMSEQIYKNEHIVRSNELQKSLDEGIISEEEYDRKKTDLDREFKTAEAKRARKVALVEKIAALFSIASDTASAIMKSVAFSPITGGQPWAGIATAIGLTQAGAVLATPLPEIPAFATGGSMITDGPQMFLAGEGANPHEEVTVTPLDSSQTNSNNNEYHFHGIQNLSQARNTLLRNEGEDAF